MIEAYPIAITKVDWQTFITVCQSTFGFSPVRSIDKSNMDTNDPASFLGALSFSDNPKEFLKEAKKNGLLNHASMSFMILSSYNRILSNLAKTKLHLTYKHFDEEILIIASGSFDDWYDAIIMGCQRSSHQNFRYLMNNVFNTLRQTGYKEVFSGIKKTQLNDGTFII